MCKGPEESEFMASFEKLQEIWYAWIIEFKKRILEKEPGDGELGKLFGQFLKAISSQDQIYFYLLFQVLKWVSLASSSLLKSCRQPFLLYIL